jgi:hypothetical protein
MRDIVIAAFAAIALVGMTAMDAGAITLTNAIVSSQRTREDSSRTPAAEHCKHGKLCGDRCVPRGQACHAPRPVGRPTTGKGE